MLTIQKCMHGVSVSQTADQNGGEILNTYVLNKMPRDYTDPYVTDMNSPHSARVSHTMQKKEVLTNLVKSGKLTSDGSDWLTLALDPFHDYQHQIAGYPDADGSATVVQCFQYAYDISKPAGSAGNWDCHVFSNPYMNYQQLYQFTATADEISGGYGIKGATGYDFGGLLNVIKTDAGEGLYPTYHAAYAPVNGTYTPLGNSTDLMQPDSRIVGFGFEVINTTAEVSKQGSITVYRMPQPTDLKDFAVAPAADTSIGKINCRSMRLLPSSPEMASRLAGSQQWTAAEGAYVVVTQNSIVNPFSNLENNAPMHLLKGRFAGGDTILTGDYVANLTAAKATGASAHTGKPTKYAPLNTGGVMLSGLSNATTLRIRMKVYVEVAPVSLASADDANLTVLATPSAGYDSNALKIYSQVVQSIPVGVPVRMNAFGDFWKGICGIMSKIAVPTLTAIGTAYGQPQLGAIAGAVGSKVWDTYAGMAGNDRPRRAGNRPASYSDPGTRVKVAKTFEPQLMVPASGAMTSTKRPLPKRPSRKQRRPAVEVQVS